MRSEIAVASLALTLLGDPAIAEVTPPDKEELASIGCILAGMTSAGLVGAATIFYTGGAAALSPSTSLTVLGTTFAAGCGVGMLVAPGVAWAFREYVWGANRPEPVVALIRY